MRVRGQEEVPSPSPATPRTSRSTMEEWGHKKRKTQNISSHKDSRLTCSATRAKASKKARHHDMIGPNIQNGRGGSVPRG